MTEPDNAIGIGALVAWNQTSVPGRISWLRFACRGEDEAERLAALDADSLPDDAARSVINAVMAMGALVDASFTAGYQDAG